MSNEEYTPINFAETIFKQRYALSNNESWPEACNRIANYIAAAEENGNRSKWSERFYQKLVSNAFVPGGRIWYGAGRPKGQLLNCFVIPTEDSREGWGKSVSDMLVISGTGGGVGMNLSPIRPRGSPIHGTGGESTGAVSLMQVINQTGEVIKAGGGRRTALMLCLDYDHFDVLEFLNEKFNKTDIDYQNEGEVNAALAKTFPNLPAAEITTLHKLLETDEVDSHQRAADAMQILIKYQKDQVLKNANISVCVDNDFFAAVENDDEIIFNWRNQEVGRIAARDLWNTLATNAWESGEPGILNKGLANDMNNIWYHKPLIATNPCGEIWLESYGCCDLGAINLANHILPDGSDFDWDTLADSVTVGVRFLDNVLDVNNYPLSEIEKNCHNVRRIGLGVMGLGHALVRLGIRYDRSEGRKVVDKLFNFIKKRSYEASTYIAAEKGSFPVFDSEKFLESGFCKTLPKDIRAKIAEYGMRNCALLTIAPTGTTSILSATSSGIEPIFAPGYLRRYYSAKVGSNERILEEEIVVDPLFEEMYNSGIDVSSMVAAHEISVENHLKMQVVCQKHIDNAVSKTINVPNDYPVDKFSEMLLKYASKLKGSTVYRSGSRGNEPLTPLTIEEAIKHLDSQQKTIIAAAQSDCPGGICEISDAPVKVIEHEPVEELLSR